MQRLFCRRVLLSDRAAVVYLAVSDLLLHLLTNSRYGYFRDELYYIACGEHLDWGYVDQPPLIAGVAKLTRWLLGGSLFALRFFPALAGAGKVLLTGWMVRELGGGRFAQSLAAVAVIVAPGYLAIDNFLSMNAFEPLFWVLCAYLTVRIFKKGNPRLWLWSGLVAGIGLMNKHSMLFFGFGLGIGLLLSPERRVFLRKWIWLAALIAFVVFLPNLLWQIQHGWPQLEVLRNAYKYKNYPVSAGEFLFGQILFLHPFAFPIWLAGLCFYLLCEEGKRYRCLGWSYLVVLGVFVILRAKIYYLAPAYPMLLASGALVMEKFTQRSSRPWLKPAMVVVLIAGGMVTAPYGLPVLPVETFIRYDAFLRLGHSVQAEREKVGKLPQLYADMFGWENLVATVASVYNGLSPGEKSKCAILADDYGEAGAIDLFGQAHHLPKAISGHNTYYLWGPRNYSGEVVITVGFSAEDLRPLFGEVERAATITNEYAMPEQQHLPVYICRKPWKPLKELWPKTRLYI